MQKTIITSFFGYTLLFVFSLLLTRKLEVAITSLVVSSVLLHYSYRKFTKYKLNNLVNPIALYIFISMLFAILSYHSSITYGSDSYPYVPGGDGESYFAQAKHLSYIDGFNQLSEIRSNFLGYQLILAIIFKIFGINYFYGIALNIIILILTTILIILFTYNVTNNKSTTKYTLYAIMLSPHFLQYGTILLKDIFIMFSFALAMYAISKIYNNLTSSTKYYFYFIMSVVFLSILRLQFLIFIFLPLLIGRRNHIQRFSILLVSISIIYFLSPIIISLTSLELSTDYVVSTTLDNSIAKRQLSEGNQGTVTNVLGGYPDYSFVKKVAFLPFSFAIQMVLPFNFYIFRFIDTHSWLFISNQLQVLWIFYLSVIFVFSIFNYKYILNNSISKFFLSGLIMYILIAFMHGGTVPRYAAPSLVYIFPTIGYFLSMASSEVRFRKRLQQFFLKYYFIGFVIFVFFIFSKLV